MDIKCIEWIYGGSTKNFFVKNETLCHLNVGAFEDMNIKMSNTTYKTCDEFALIIEVLIKKLKCSLSFHFHPDGIGGHYVNGKWTGLLNMLFLNKIDIIGTPMIYRSERLNIADPIHPFYVGNIITILSAPYKVNDLFGIFISFSPFEWLLIFLLLILLIMISFSRVLKINPNVNKYDSISMIFWNYLSILIGKSTNSRIMTKDSYSSLLFIFWCVNCAFWMQLFTSDLLANLTTKSKVTIDNLQQLYHNENMKILMENIGYAYTVHFKNVENDERIIKRIEPFNSEELIHSEKMLSKLLSGKYAMIADETDIDQFMETNPYLPLYKSKQKLFLGISGIFLRKSLDIHLKSHIKEKIKLLHQNGIYRWRALKNTRIVQMTDRINSAKNNLIRSTEIDSKSLRRLFLSDVMIALLILSFGFPLGFVLFISEILFRRIGRTTIF